MDVKKIRRALISLNLSQASRDTGISHKALSKIKYDPTHNANLHTLQTLDKYITGLSK